MWSGENDDDDVNNDNGERVRLYQPMLYGRKPTLSNLSSSFIGGQSTSSSSALKLLPSLSTSSFSTTNCPTCHDPLKQLVQLFIPKSSSSSNNTPNVDRTLIVSACNRASCVAGLFSNDKDNNGSSMFSKGGGNGVIVCKRFMVENEANIKHESKVAATDDAMAPDDDQDDNDWTVDDMQGDDNDLDDLEAKLASMESTTTNSKANSSCKKKSNPKSEKSIGGEGGENATTSGTTSFPCFELHSVQEPPARRPVMDEDDVGISASGASNDKIQQMLARYMQEEEDEDILAMLRNEAHGGSGCGGGGGSSSAIAESDPGVSPQDRALLRFSDRLQRSPRQVLRYAYNGQPLWSVPLPSPNKNKKGSRKQQGKKTRNDCDDGNNEDDVIQVPPCSNCRAPRVFEAQILPSILHVLDVDRYAPTDATAADNANNNKAYNNYYTAASGGMDFGNIAIYTCSAACDAGQDEYVVVQDSVDKLQQQQQLPVGRQHQAQGQRRMYSNNEVVVIPEDSKFDDNDEA